MKINFKKGLRRIIISLLGFGVIIALFSFISEGCIFDNTKFIENTKLFKPTTPDITLNFKDFANAYLTNSNNSQYWFSDFKCHPYKQYCIFENNKYYNNKIHKFTVYNLTLYSNESLLNLKNTGEFLKTDIKILMPTRLQYFTWQVKDFFIILLIATLLYSFYLILETILCWIIRGFQND